VTLKEITSAYTVFPNSGVYVEPILVKRIEDRFGNVLEDNSEVPLLDASEIPQPVPREEIRSYQNMDLGTDDSEYDEEEGSADTEPAESEVTDAPEQAAADSSSISKAGGPKRSGSSHKRARAAMSPQTAYIMTNLLHGVATQGTGARMRKYLPRSDLAGKTGTTQRSADAWFIGFNPDFTAGVWVGFDEKRPLGRREEGGRAALPIWGYFMKEVLNKRPEREFPVPPYITFKEMLTVDGISKEGFVTKPVREPIYTPFVNRTLVLSPVDTPEILASYRGVNLPEMPYAPGPPPGTVPPAPTGGLSLHPMDGRNLFPEETEGVQAPAPAQPNLAPGVPPGYPAVEPPQPQYTPPPPPVAAPPPEQTPGTLQGQVQGTDQEMVRPRSRSKYEPLFYQQRNIRQ